MRSLLLLLTLLLPLACHAGGAPHIGTWELRRFQHDQRVGQEYPIHRITLSDDGVYMSSATPKGPIPTKYKTEKNTGNHGQIFFLIEDPDTGKYARVAIVRVDKRGLTMTYDRDGRVLTYTGFSPKADRSLLDSVPKKTITIEPKE